MKKILLVLYIIVIADICQGEERTWTNNKKQNIKAEYVSCDNGIVKL